MCQSRVQSTCLAHRHVCVISFPRKQHDDDVTKWSQNVKARPWGRNAGFTTSRRKRRRAKGGKVVETGILSALNRRVTEAFKAHKGGCLLV